MAEALTTAPQAHAQVALTLVIQAHSGVKAHGRNGLDGGCEVEARVLDVGTLVVEFALDGLEAQGATQHRRGVGRHAAEVAWHVVGLGGVGEVGHGAHAEAADLLEQLGETLWAAGEAALGAGGRQRAGQDEQVELALLGLGHEHLEAFGHGLEGLGRVRGVDGDRGGVAAQQAGGSHDPADAFGGGAGVGGGQLLRGLFHQHQAGAAGPVGGVTQAGQVVSGATGQQIGRQHEAMEPQLLVGEAGQVGQGQAGVLAHEHRAQGTGGKGEQHWATVVALWRGIPGLVGHQWQSPAWSIALAHRPVLPGGMRPPATHNPSSV